MRKALIAVIVVLGANACSSEPTGVAERSIVAGVMLDGRFYILADQFDPAAAPLGPRYATVLRLVDCSSGYWLNENTHVDDHCILHDGDSNILAAGTPIYRVAGVQPGERLAVQEHGSWHLLKSLAGSECSGTSSVQPGTLSPPGCGE
jgi:hypothetical protein